MNDKITFTTGLRSDYHSDFGRHNTPSAVLSYQPDEKTNYYVSYKEFFVAPGISQLYYHDAYGNTGNPNLKSVAVIRWNLGLSISLIKV